MSAQSAATSTSESSSSSNNKWGKYFYYAYIGDIVWYSTFAITYHQTYYVRDAYGELDYLAMWECVGSFLMGFIIHFIGVTKFILDIIILVNIKLKTDQITALNYLYFSWAVSCLKNCTLDFFT